MQLAVPVICKDLGGIENLARYSSTSFSTPYYFLNQGIRAAIIEIQENSASRSFPLETIITTEKIGLSEREPLSVEGWLHYLFRYPKDAPKEVHKLNFFDWYRLKRSNPAEPRDEFLNKTKNLAYFFKEVKPLPQAHKTRTTYYIWSQIPEGLNQSLIREVSQHLLPQTP